MVNTFLSSPSLRKSERVWTDDRVRLAFWARRERLLASNACF